MKRLFLALNLPIAEKKKINQALSKIRSQFNSAEIRFLEPANWHLTLAFLGYQNDAAFPAIINACRKTVAQFEPPQIEFNKMVYGPLDKKARMIWLINAQNKDAGLGALAKNLNENFLTEEVKFKLENRPFFAHLTLARFAKSLSQPIKLPEIKINFEAGTLDLMESKLKRSGAEYALLSQFDFSKRI